MEDTFFYSCNIIENCHVDKSSLDENVSSLYKASFSMTSMSRLWIAKGDFSPLPLFFKAYNPLDTSTSRDYIKQHGYVIKDLDDCKASSSQTMGNPLSCNTYARWIILFWGKYHVMEALKMGVDNNMQNVWLVWYYCG
ncbi:hypothetical protein FNV43_RR11113 [Rhamnella rubrinervis]|uniref:Uncharacterized protein n=1 Tax=Rhamnella rubrinervis TaxID=2594499 RepID=A0A8K0H4Z2_9ROSA|nr:hypothetical protein FNV43_RR11113 [Rhamnella rubrinervis]